MASLAVPALAADGSTVKTVEDATVTIDSVHATENGSVVVGGSYSCEYRTTVDLEAGYLGHLDPADGSGFAQGLYCGPKARAFTVEVPLDDLVIPGRPGTAEVRLTGAQGEVLEYVTADRSVDWADAKPDWESYILKADAAGAAAKIDVALKCVVGAQYWVRLAVWEADGPKGATRSPLTPCESGTARTTISVPGDGPAHTDGADVTVTMRLETGDGAVLNERSIGTRFGY
uniref:hypothetical protein n=1 Tax=Lentzea alba TaxID=2714351 RepID=UPI0039BED5BC